VRIAGVIGEAVVLAMGRDPFDHRSLDRRRAEDGEQRSQRAGGLEAAMGEEPVITHRDAEPAQHVGDREHEQVLPVQGSAPRQPCPDRERGRREGEDQRAHDALARLVLDRDRLGDAHLKPPSIFKPISRKAPLGVESL
jgi:hypothetical protein